MNNNVQFYKNLLLGKQLTVYKYIKEFPIEIVYSLYRLDKPSWYEFIILTTHIIDITVHEFIDCAVCLKFKDSALELTVMLSTLDLLFESVNIDEIPIL